MTNALENEKQWEEIRRLKATIESIEKTIKDLMDIARRVDGKIHVLALKEKKVEKKIENLEMKHTRDLHVLEDNFSSKMNDIKNNLSDQMANMHKNLEKLILQNQGQDTNIEKELLRKQKKRQNHLSPIFRSHSQSLQFSATDKKPSKKFGTPNILPRISD